MKHNERTIRNSKKRNEVMLDPGKIRRARKNTRLQRTVCGISILLFLQSYLSAFAQNDLPNPTPNFELIKTGSLVIGMDNTTQAVPGYFNLKSYGLVNKLLKNNIPIKWAIKAGKAKDGIDFTATAQREYPAVLPAATYNYKAGPFIIDSAYAQSARAIIAAWGNNVAVYRLTQDVSVDIRYTLNFIPRIAIFNHGKNAKIHLAYLIEAGIDTSTYVTVIPELQPLDPCMNGYGFSFASEAHWDDQSDTAISRSVYRFVKNGGNFLAACIAIRLYENDDTLHSTTGFDVINDGYNTFAYNNADMPFIQIDGPLADIGGAMHNWYKKPTGNFRSSQYRVAGAPTGIPYQTAAVSKYTAANLSGGNMFYLGGHSYGNKNENEDINGRRMYLNAVFVPPGASAYCNMQPLTVSLLPQSVRCHGENNGAVITTVNGGISPYKYNWSNSSTSKNLTNLGPGTYTVVVTDNIGQTTTASVTITDPAALAVSRNVSTYNGNNVSCMSATNGFVNLTVSGGTAPFTYNWSPSGNTSKNLTNAGAGTHSYTVTDANGCVYSSSVTLTEPPPVVSTRTISNYNGSNVSCSGASNGFINLNVSGGTGPYSYAWSPGGSTAQNLTGIGAGNYAYVVTDANGCTSSGTASLAAPGALATVRTTSNFNGSGVSCSGATDGFINTTVSGGTGPYTYSWTPGGIGSPNRTNLPAGTYSYTITDANGCTVSNSATLIAPQALSSPNTTSNYNGSGISCYGATNGFINLAVSGGTTPYSFQWSPNGSTTQNLNNLGAGTYSYVVTDANGCSKTGTATLAAPNPLTAPVSTSNYNGSGISCAGSTNGFINLSVGGGTPPYGYAWSTGASNSATLTNIGAGSYSYTVTDANGCSVSGSRVITAPSPLNAPAASSDFNGSGITCNGTNDGYINLTVSGGTGPYAYNWTTGVSTQNLTNLGAGTYGYTVTDANGCSSSGSVTLTAPAALHAPYAVSNYNGTNISCNGSSNGSVDLTVSGGTAPYSYYWNPTGSTDEDLSNVGAGTYTYTVTDANGCVVTDAVTLTASNSLLTPYTTSNYNGSGVSCQGATNGFINLAVSGGTGPYDFNWSPGGETTQNLTGIGAGSYTYIVTDANGCSSSGSVTLSAPAPLDAPYALSNYNGNGISCFGATNGYINLSVSGGSGPYSYAWMPSGGNSPGLSNLSAGTYSYVVTDANGCTVSNSITLTSPAPLSVPYASSNYNGSGVSCYGSTDGNIALTVNGGTAPYSYNWLPGNSTASGLNNLGAGTYFYSVTDANGCSFSDAVTLSAPNPLAAPFVASSYNGSGVSCAGASNGYINLSVNGGTGPYSYHWSPVSGTSQSLGNLSSGTYSYTVTDMNGCTVSDHVTLTAPAPLNNSMQVSTSNGFNISCYAGNDGSIDLSVSGGTGPYNYNWIPGHVSTQDLSGLNAGIYTVTVTDQNGCLATTSITLNSPPALSVTGYVMPARCYGAMDGSIQTTVQGGVPGYSYAWSNGSAGAVLSAVGSGNYSLTITDANGCTATDNYLITQPAAINLSINTPALNGNYNISCHGLSDGSALAAVNGGTSPYTYQWSGGQSSMGIYGIPAGTYSLSVTDGNNCQVTQSIILAEPPPIVVSAGVSQDVCGNTAALDAMSVSAGLSGSWIIQNGSGTFSDVLNPQATVSGLSYGNNQFIWKVTDGICTATDRVQVVAFEPVQAVAGSNDAICPKLSDGYSLNALPAGNGTGTWNSGGLASISDPHDPNSRVYGLSAGDNIFVWTVTNGPCTSSSEVNIILKSREDCYEDLEMPTAFTPNGDGVNDDFDIHGIEKYPQNTFRVFNRWGNLVYSADDYVNHQWKGTNSDREPLPDGTYFVILVIKGNQIKLNGYVDLRR